MARAIVRTSINGRTGNSLQTQLRKRLESVGFSRIGTGTYEGDFPAEDDALDGVQTALDFLRALPSGYRIDHLWIYLDEVDHP